MSPKIQLGNVHFLTTIFHASYVHFRGEHITFSPSFGGPTFLKKKDGEVPKGAGLCNAEFGGAAVEKLRARMCGLPV